MALAPAAFAEIVAQGDVILEGGDPQNDGPIPDDFDLIALPEDDLFVDDLALLLVDNGSTVDVGAIATQGTINIDLIGAGTQVLLTATDRSRIDLLDSGTFNVLDGAVVDASDPCIGCSTLIGIRAGGIVNFQVSGAGSLLRATEVIAAEARVEGAFTGNSTAGIDVNDGGRIESSEVFVSVGANADPTGAVVTTALVAVRDVGSQWTFTGWQAATGENAVAQIDVLNGGSLLGESMVLSNGVNSTTTFTIDGPSSLDLSDDLVIADAAGAVANVLISNGGASLVGGGADVGSRAGSGISIGRNTGVGTLVVDNGSLVVGAGTGDPSATIVVGDGGTGGLGVLNGATVDVLDEFSLDGDDGVVVGISRAGQIADGAVVVDGAGSSLTITSDTRSVLDIGVASTPLSSPDAATGTVTVSNGGTVLVNGPGEALLTLGRGANSTGTLDVFGVGSQVLVDASLAIVAIGNDFTDAVGSGTGTVTVRDGGVLSVLSPNPDSSFLLVGAGSGDGVLNVGANGTVNAELIEIAAPSQTNDLQTGVVNLDAGGVINANIVRVFERGTLTGDGLLNASEIEVLGGTVALDNYDNIELLTLNGPGGSIAIANNTIAAGRVGGQAFRLDNGAAFAADQARVADGAGLQGGIEVFAGSVLNFAGPVLVGSAGGNGRLLLDTGGELTLNGVLNQPAPRLEVGRGGDGSVDVLNGARLQVGQSAVDVVGPTEVVIGTGQAGDGLGRINVQGIGSLLDVQGGPGAGGATVSVGRNLLDDGSASTGELIVSDGASVNLAGTGGDAELMVGVGESATGTVTVQTNGQLVLAADNAVLDIGGGAVGGNGTVSILSGGLIQLNSTPQTGVVNVGLLAGNGVLNVQDGGALEIDGALNVGQGSGTGVVSLTGTGRVQADTVQVGANGTLTGDGNLQVGTLSVLAGGTLELANLSGVQNLTLDGAGASLQQNADLVFGEGQSPGLITVSGGAAVAAGGDIQLQAGTRLDVTGAGTTLTSGQLDVSGGALFLADGAAATAANISVSNGGLLAGSGALNAGAVLVGNGGTLSPGFSPGEVTINGDLTLNGGAILFEIAGTEPQDYDRLIVNGNLNFAAGTVTVDLLDGFQPETTDTFDVLTVSGEVTQSPDVVFTFNGLGPDFEFSFRNDAQATVGQIQFLAIDIAEIAELNENQGGVGLALDSLCPRIEGLEDPTPEEQDLDLLCGGLRNGNNTDEQIAAALDAIAPDEITGTIDTLLRFTTVQHGNLSQRLNGLRNGAARINLSGLNLTTAHGVIRGADLQSSLEGLLGTLGGGAGSEDFARWGFFGDANIKRADRDADAFQPGFDTDATHVTFGADYRLRDDLFVGVALGYNEINSDFDSVGGLTVESTTLTVLGTYFNEKQYYADALVTFGLSDAESRRQIVYQDANGTVNRRARGDTEGDQIVYSLAGGRDFNKGKWTFGPHVGFNHSELKLDGYAEEGAGGLNMRLPDQVTRTQTANAGFHVSYTATPSWGVLVPYARLDYVHEFKDAGQSPDVRFANDRFASDPTNPTRVANLQTPDSDSSYVVWSAGVHAQFVNGVAAFVNYRSHEGLSDFDIQDVSIGIRLEKSF